MLRLTGCAAVTGDPIPCANNPRVEQKVTALLTGKHYLKLYDYGSQSLT